MRNLRITHRSLVKCPENATKSPLCAWDAATDSVVCAHGPANDDLIELRRWHKHDKSSTLIASWEAPCPPIEGLEYEQVLDLHYFCNSLTAVLVLAGGDLVVVREDPDAGVEKIEIVGSVDAGITAAAWSPDEELLVLTTKASTLLYMTKDFDNVANITFTPEDLKASNHVSVGWGKKETQFQGKKARALRDPTMPETVDEGVLSDGDTKNNTITWRGDGAYLAVNSIEAGSRRIIRVYSREGVLDSVSEPVDGLVGALSWRPAGNLLAGVQYAGEQTKVVFFERNGLRHGQFDLRLSQDDLSSWASDMTLKWNIDSSTLAVCFKDRVQFWTMANYHYYLKQEIFAMSEDTVPVLLTWHPEKPLHFTLGSRRGLQRFTFASVVARSSTSPPDDYGVVAVIDGTVVKVTPMRVANVPPPMSLYEMKVPGNAIDVCFATRSMDKPTIFIAILHQKGISVFDWPIDKLSRRAPSLVSSVNMSEYESDDLRAPLQIASANASYMVAFLDSDGSQVKVLSLSLQLKVNGIFRGKGFIEGFATNGPSAEADSYILLVNDLRLDKAAFEQAVTHFNILSNYTLGFSTMRTSRTESLSCNVARDEEKVTPKSKTIFSLTEQGSLYADQRCLIRNCTSFLITPAHLIFTTSQHLLKFVHLGDSVDELEIPPDTPEADERCRSIERGARLVTVMPSIFAIVLQMPRGNLETIYPRALVLAGIRDSIEQKKYKKAFFACRNMRVDMNIIHDHASSQFQSNILLFIDQIVKVEHIDLFLSQLREEDVSKTMYQETIQRHSAHVEDTQISVESSFQGSKINRICDGFLDALSSRPSKYLQSMITAHVCKAPPNLDAGLALIASLRKQKSDKVDTAIEHICFLADVNRLYDNALGLYDLELTLLIAQQSQKDPREYLPFLQNLQKMPSLRMRYSIDNHLSRHRKALQHLCDLDVFEEVKNYTVKHGLYSEALNYYQYQEKKLSEIVRLHADHLQSNGKFKDAGIAYEYLQDYASASESFRQAHLWQESLSCATLVPLPQEQLKSLAQTLADTQIESKKFSSAATIHIDYLSDIPGAARLFCKGYFFADALRIVGLHQRTDLLESVIDAGLVEGMANMTELLADCKSQLNAQIPRLRELRAKKADDPLAFFEGDIPGGGDVPDNVSIAPTDASTTGGSLFTRYTNRTGTVGTNASRRTSKNRRREERKRARGKKGSVYEEEYLVGSVGRLIERVNSVGDEVERLVVGLLRRGMRERARAVEAAMDELVELCKGCVGEVFQTPVGDIDTPKDEAKVESERPSGGEGVLWDTLEDGKPREAPIVKDFAKLSLLGR